MTNTPPKVVNLTPHVIEVVDRDGCVLVSFPPSGDVARCHMEYLASGELLAEAPVGLVRYGRVHGLPDPFPFTRYLVSVLVMLACPDRDDLLTVASEVRDDEGRVVGCRGLASSVERG